MTRPSRGRIASAAVFAGLLALYVLGGVGLVSSNDGSHLALVRALALRGEPSIDPDAALTLGVDVALRDGHFYSDRPPGTALAALVPAALLGRLDEPVARATERRGAVYVRPAGPRYVATYAARFPRAPALYRFQGSVAAARISAAAAGALGTAGTYALATAVGAGPVAAATGAFALALGSLWSVYATCFFSHVFAGAFLVWAAVLALRTERSFARPAAAGACAAMAAACQYAAVVPAGLVLGLLLPRRRRAVVAAAVGAAGPCALAAAYHTVAFGGPLAIGYDFARFAFARSRLATFAGDPLQGAWVLLGPGNRAGLVAVSPLFVPGAVYLVVHAPRLAVPALSFLLLLCFHRTPEGGAFSDHRYLVPILPFFAAGAALLAHRVMSAPRRVRLPALFAMLALLGYGLVQAWAHARFVHGTAG